MNDSGSMRLDKWLWAARFYKTRQLAAAAVGGGHVTVNGARAKPARAIKPNDRVTVRRAPFSYEIVVLGLSERRLAAKLAQQLYRELEESIEQRERLRLQLRSQAAQILYEPKRPTVRDRREARQRKRGDS